MEWRGERRALWERDDVDGDGSQTQEVDLSWGDLPEVTLVSSMPDHDEG